jgi:hypothetical protein
VSPDGDFAVRVEPAATAEQAVTLLAACSPGVVNPAGERVEVASEWADEIGDDPQRLALLPAALAALEQPHEIWCFAGEEKGASVEHWPHLLWCRVGDAPAELVIAGTRRVGQVLRLHTWFRYAERDGVLRRYWETGRAVHPVRTLRSAYAPGRDVLTLRPDPPAPYRVVRVLARPSMFAYLDARLGFPAVVGFEVQDARAHVEELTAAAAPAGLLELPCLVDGAAEPAPLRTWLARLLAATEAPR